MIKNNDMWNNQNVGSWNSANGNAKTQTDEQIIKAVFSGGYNNFTVKKYTVYDRDERESYCRGRDAMICDKWFDAKEQGYEGSYTDFVKKAQVLGLIGSSVNLLSELLDRNRNGGSTLPYNPITPQRTPPSTGAIIGWSVVAIGAGVGIYFIIKNAQKD